MAFRLLLLIIMARKPRIIATDATYHVTAKANRAEHILYEDNFKLLFMEVLKSAKKKFKFELVNLVIMSNHVHLMIKPGAKESLSSIMQWILSVFAVRYNRLNNLKGHVWYDRFKSKVTATLLQFVRTYVYITENPLKAGICNNYQKYYYSGINLRKFQRYRDLLSEPELKITRIIERTLEKRHQMIIV